MQSSQKHSETRPETPQQQQVETSIEHAKLELHAQYVLRRAEAVEETGITRHNDNDEQEDDEGWKEVVRRCATAAASVQANADLKLKAYEIRVSHLEEQLALEQAENTRLVISNETLRRQLDKYEMIGGSPGASPSLPADERDLTAEHHLNQLVASRNAAVKEAAALKRKFLQHACEECRLNLKRKPEADETPSTPISARRPTYQSSARHVLENLPKHSSPTRSPAKEAKKRKSIMETGPENGNQNDVDESTQNGGCDLGEGNSAKTDRAWSTTPASAILPSKQKVDFKSHVYVGKYGRGPFRYDR